VPKDKPMTKWEQYAKTKNIKKRKKSTMVWDDQAKVCQSCHFTQQSLVLFILLHSVIGMETTMGLQESW
jgi:hypothetical protein